MKILKITCLIAYCTMMLAACGGDSATATQAKQDAHAGHDHSHDGHDHAGHNHSHDGHDHSGHDHSHDGHDHSHHGHDHSGHDHSHVGHDQKQKEVSAEEMEKRKELQAKKEAAKNGKATAAELATAKALCACLTKIPTLKKVLKATDEASFEKAAADNVEDVKAMQECHNTIVTKAIKTIPDAQKGVYAYRARREANKNCLNRDNDDLWFLMGKFVAKKSSPSSKMDIKRPHPDQIKKSNN